MGITRHRLRCRLSTHPQDGHHEDAARAGQCWKRPGASPVFFHVGSRGLQLGGAWVVRGWCRWCGVVQVVYELYGGGWIKN